MISTSNEFLIAARANPRRCKAKLDFLWTSPITDSSITASANDTNRAALLTQVSDNYQSNTRKWAHLDYDYDGASGGFKADGSFNPMPADDSDVNNQVGWYGATACNAFALWTVNPQLTVEFDARPLLALLVAGEAFYNEYPVDFDIRVYSGAVLQYTEVVTDNDGLLWVKNVSDQGLTDITKIVLEVKKWSLANRVVKISEFYTSFAQTVEDEDIVSLSLTEERILSDGSLPVGNVSANEIDITLQNIKMTVEGSEVIDPFFPFNSQSPFYTLIKKNRRVTPYIGFVLADDSIEYVKLGTFWTGDWKVSEDSPDCSVSARDRLELLRNAEFKGSTLYEDISLYDLAEAILQIAVTDIPMSDLNWRIDESLQNMIVPYAWFPRQNYFKIIKQIAEAAVTQAYMDRNDVLIIGEPDPDDMTIIVETGSQPNIIEESGSQPDIYAEGEQ